MHAELAREAPKNVKVLRLGANRPDRRYAILSNDDGPVLAVELRAEFTLHEEVLLWRDWLVIGFANFVHLVRLDTHGSAGIFLDAQFVALHPLEDVLLVASTDRIRAVKADGLTAWTSAPLRNGTKILSIHDGVIEGEGFTLSLATGKESLVAQQRPE